DRARYAAFTTGTQAVEIGPAHQTGASAERQRTQDVGAGADSAIEHHLDVGADRIDNLWQRRDRRRRAVELPPAVVRHHQRGCASLGGEPGILDVKDALEDQLAGPEAPDPIDIFPVERRIELPGNPARERIDVLHALHVAGDVAEGLALAAQGAERPGRLGR